jgi:hypothetical protein
MEEFPNPQEVRLQELLGPIVARFTITQIPLGSVSESIRKEWVGVTLPVREKSLEDATENQVYFDAISGNMILNTEAVSIYGSEAIDALESAGHEGAAEFWRSVGVENADLVFRASEGELASISGVNKG